MRALWAAAAGLGGCSAAQFADVRIAAAPVAIQGVSSRASNPIETLDLSFASPAGGRVPVRLIRPVADRRPVPAVVFQHQLGAGMEAFDGEAQQLAGRCGIAGLLVAAPFARPDPWRRSFDWRLDGRDAGIQRQAVLDLRRVFAIMPRFRLDIRRVAFVGHSYGANWGGILSALEKRYRAFVLIAGVGSVTEEMNGDVVPWREIRDGLGTEGFARYRASLRRYDPVNYVGRARPGSLFFQFALRDEFVSPERARSFAAAAGASHRIGWYETDHDFVEERSRADRMEFLALQLDAACASPAS